MKNITSVFFYDMATEKKKRYTLKMVSMMNPDVFAPIHLKFHMKHLDNLVFREIEGQKLAFPKDKPFLYDTELIKRLFDIMAFSPLPNSLQAASMAFEHLWAPFDSFPVKIRGEKVMLPILNYALSSPVPFSSLPDVQKNYITNMLMALEASYSPVLFATVFWHKKEQAEFFAELDKLFTDFSDVLTIEGMDVGYKTIGIVMLYKMLLTLSANLLTSEQTWASHTIYYIVEGIEEEIIVKNTSVSSLV